MLKVSSFLPHYYYNPPPHISMSDVEEDFSISEDEGAGSSEEEEEQRKVLPQRKSRGVRRVQTVQDGDEDADEEFWGQGAWKEEEEDDDIKSDEFSSGAFGDSSDSDIDYDETADVAAEEKAALLAEKQVGKRVSSTKAVIDDTTDQVKKRGKYVDPALVKRSSSAKKQDVAASKPKRKVVRIPQQDMLCEVVKTEHENKRQLVEMILLQEAAKTRREAWGRKREDTARVIYTSSARRGERYSYNDPAMFPQAKTLPPYPKRVSPPPGATVRYRFPGAMNQTYTTAEEYQHLVKQKQLQQQQRAQSPVVVVKQEQQLEVKPEPTTAAV